ncbi:MAG: NADH-quinone oxidoreductase subunit NuoE [Angustibacter sp.]
MSQAMGRTELPQPRVPQRPEPFPPDVLAQLRADAETVIARYPKPRSALLPLLHLVQSQDGYVSERGIEFCADLLDLTTAEVTGVATFYTQYKRHPNGTYTLGVCTNTLCAVMGGDEIFDAVSEHLDVGHDQTTPDGAITLERVECNAACDYAPVVMVNWEFFDNQTPSSTRELADRLRSGEAVRPTRGASSVCTFREMSRVLAGFSDGRADEGIGAGDPTVVGLRIARERGWDSGPEASHGAAGRDGAPDGRHPQGWDEQVAAEHVRHPSKPSANDATARRPGGDAGSVGAAHERDAPSPKERR